MNAKNTDDIQKVPLAGLEPARPCGQQILSLGCLPFHHSGLLKQKPVNADPVRGERSQLNPSLSILICKGSPPTEYCSDSQRGGFALANQLFSNRSLREICFKTG